MPRRRRAFSARKRSRHEWPCASSLHFLKIALCGVLVTHPRTLPSARCKIIRGRPPPRSRAPSSRQESYLVVPVAAIELDIEIPDNLSDIPFNYAFHTIGKAVDDLFAGGLSH